MPRAYLFAILMCVAAGVLVALAVLQQQRGLARPRPPAPPTALVSPPGPARLVADPYIDVISDSGENIVDAEALAEKVRAIAPAKDARVEATDAIVASCGGREVMQALQQLHTCAVINGQCDGGRDERVVVNFLLLLKVSSRFALHAEYFDTGVDQIVDRKGVETFVLEHRRGEEIDFLVFGGASPTARRQAVDHRLASRRALATRNVMNDLLRGLRDDGPDIQQANIGKNLSEDYCAAMAPTSAAACFALDRNARRQVSFVVAVPRLCLVAELKEAT